MIRWREIYIFPGENVMLEQLKDRDLILGVIMVVAGVLVWFELAKFTGIGLVVYGLYQYWGPKPEVKVEEHHHHHHHNKKQTTTKKTGKMKKNYQRT